MVWRVRLTIAMKNTYKAEHTEPFGVFGLLDFVFIVMNKKKNTWGRLLSWTHKHVYCYEQKEKHMGAFIVMNAWVCLL